ncbi:MAG: metal-dependent transcriptional regulator [Clostridia bacterium]|nr:metal-dependent transcriptional regulator [Clostridia bacterium]
MKLYESGEMYLETILILSNRNEFVRSVDVGEYMGFSKPSVSRAVGLLKNGGYLTVDKDGHLFLTEEGKIVAERTYERHTILTAFFERLGVDPDTAVDDACRIEHCISEKTFDALKKHIAEL